MLSLLRSSTIIRRMSFPHIRTNTIQQIPPPQTTRLDLDQLLERLDGEAHRRGRLNPGLVRGAIRKAAIEHSTLNPTQALLLIRCTGSLLISELPRQRQQVLNHMMNIFREKNVLFDVTHYNSYMRVSLQNNFFFDPMKTLEEMKKKGIQANLTSFRLFCECYARQGQSEEIQKILNEMKSSNFNIEPLVLTHLLGSFAEQGHIERLDELFQLFHELQLTPISETYEQYLIAYFKKGHIDQAKKYFLDQVSKFDNDSLFRLLVKCAQYDQKDFFRLILNSIDKNSLADTCVQYIVCATELLDANLDDYAFLLVDSFPKRDETLRFDVINLTMLNLMKIRLPMEHFRPFSAITLDDIQNNLESTIHYQCERESVSEDQLRSFRKNVIRHAENFLEKKDRWLAIHQLLHHAYQNYIPLPYIYAIYDAMRTQKYEYRPHYMRPILVKFRRIFVDQPNEISEELSKFLAYLQKNFSINYDQETIDLLIEFCLNYCRLKAMDIDTLLKKVNIPFANYWSNLYHCTLKQIDLDHLNSLTAFLNANKTVRFEYTSTIREQTNQAIQSLINQWKTSEKVLEYFNDLINFIVIVNKRFGKKGSSDLSGFNDGILLNIIENFYEKDRPESIEFLKKIFQFFDQRAQSIPLTSSIREQILKQLGMKSSAEINDRLMRNLRRESEKSSSESSLSSSLNESSDIYVKSIKSTRNLSIRELEDHLIELKHKKLNTSGIISKLLTKYCTESLDSERTMTNPMKESYKKRIEQLEKIYFDKKQTTGFPSLGVMAILIDYYSRVELNLEKVISYINLSNEYDPQFKLDPHKCVSVIRLLIRKNSYAQAIELIDSLGRYDVIPNYMYRRVRDLLIDGYSLLSFEQFQILVKKLFENNYVEPSSIVLSLIVRKAYHDHGPLYAFDVIKTLLVQYNNLVGMFPIIRKLLRDDCTEELKQVLIKIGKIRSRTYAYEQLAFALIHERRLAEAVKVCQHISRGTFDEHCQRYVRELFYFPSDTPTSDDPFETQHVFDMKKITLIHFIEYIEQYPFNARQLSFDTLFFSLFKAYEKLNRLDEFTKFMRDYSMKYHRYFSSKTKDAFSQAGIILPIKSLSSPKSSPKRLAKHERFLHDQDYEEDSQSSNIF